MRLTVIIPVYNETHTIAQVIERALAQPLDANLEREIIVVDDGSTDGTAQAIAAWSSRVRICTHTVNRGKGAAVRSGLAQAQGDFILIQDADLEYNPADWPRMLAPLLAGEADVVYGSRFMGQSHRSLMFWHALGNRILTLWSNMWTNLNLTDMETGAKAFRRACLEGVSLRSNRFGFEPEFTAKVAHRGMRVFEVGISYRGRTYQEGKKITWWDGIAALWHVMRWNIAALVFPPSAVMDTRAGIRNSDPAAHTPAGGHERRALPQPPPHTVPHVWMAGSMVVILALAFCFGITYIYGDGDGYYFLYRQISAGNWSLSVPASAPPFQFTRFNLLTDAGWSTYFQIGMPLVWAVALPLIEAFLPPSFTATAATWGDFSPMVAQAGLAILILNVLLTAFICIATTRWCVRSSGQSAAIAAGAALGAFFGMPVWYYAFQFPSYVHTVELAFLVAGVLLLSPLLGRYAYTAVDRLSSRAEVSEEQAPALRNTGRTVHATRFLIWAGVMFGCAALVRIDAVIFIVTGALLLAYRFRNVRIPLQFAATASWGLAAQLLVWRVLTGAWLPGGGGYQAGSFFSTGFHGYEVLFGGVRGFFTYSPVAVAGIVGLLWMYRTCLRARLLALWGLMTVLLYVVWYGAWPEWWAGVSFGQRYFIPLFPFIALGIGSLIRSVNLTQRRLVRGSAAVIAAATTVYTIVIVMVSHPQFQDARKELTPVSAQVQSAREQYGFPAPHSWGPIASLHLLIGPRVIHLMTLGR